VTEAIYRISCLEHAYDGNPVLAIDRLEIPRGGIIGFVGPNGSGKSTLLRLLGLIEKPTRGKIEYQGHPVEPFSGHARFQITLLPQEAFLMKRSVFKNVAYGLKLRGDRHIRKDAVEKALSLVGLSFENYAHRAWYALSGGEARRVALAARLILEPKVLLMDEPTAAIDAYSAELVKEAAFNARSLWGTTLIIASHDRPWLSDVCDDILTLFRGRLMVRENVNMIFGPWLDLGDGRIGKRLADGQEIQTPTPPRPDSVAMVNVVLAEDSIRPEEAIVLHGMVLRLNLERKSGKANVSIAVGNLSLTITVFPEQIHQKGLFPGKPATLQYDKNGIEWQ
jgi:tungstate transport system ATP-binding protein